MRFNLLVKILTIFCTISFLFADCDLDKVARAEARLETCRENLSKANQAFARCDQDFGSSFTDGTFSCEYEWNDNKGSCWLDDSHGGLNHRFACPGGTYYWHGVSGIDGGRVNCDHAEAYRDHERSLCN